MMIYNFKVYLILFPVSIYLGILGEPYSPERLFITFLTLFMHSDFNRSHHRHPLAGTRLLGRTGYELWHRLLVSLVVTQYHHHGRDRRKAVLHEVQAAQRIRRPASGVSLHLSRRHDHRICIPLHLNGSRLYRSLRASQSSPKLCPPSPWPSTGELFHTEWRWGEHTSDLWDRASLLF